MFQRDYILRQIEQMTQALIEVLHLRREKKFDAATVLISKTARGLLSFDLDIVDSLPTEDLIRFLQHDDVFDTGKSYIMARLMLEKADIARDKGLSRLGRNIREKALLLLIEPVLRDSRFGNTDDHLRISQILKELNETDLPVLLRARLMDYFEQLGAYSHAEDILLLAREQGEEFIVQKGRVFYMRLSGLDEERLHKGNFSRGEVDDGLKLFKN